MIEAYDPSEILAPLDAYIDSFFSRNLTTITTLLIVAVALLALSTILLIVLLRRGSSTQVETVMVPAATVATQPAPANVLALNGVDEGTAALVMATLANQLGEPIESLRFRSITRVASAPVAAAGSLGEITLRNVPEKTAAFVMAIVADTLKTPLNQLRFISIKRVD